MDPVQSAAVRELFDRYLINLDDDELDEAWAKQLFADDVSIEFGPNRHDGIAGIAEYHRANRERFERTQHLNSPAVVDDAGADTAVLRSNLISTHVYRHAPATTFTAGVLVKGRARRTPDGWRLVMISYRVVWTDGNPPVDQGTR